MHKPAHLYRDQTVLSPTTSDGPFMGSNPRRRMLIISCPVPTDTPVTSDGTITGGADTSTTGVKCTYTVPAGLQAELDAGTMWETTGTTVVAAFQLVRSGVTVNLEAFTKNGVFAGPMALIAGDVLQWNVTTAVALSVTDFAISIRKERTPSFVCLSLKGPAVLGEGITLYAGGPPLILLPEDVAQGMREEIRCIASVSGLTVGVVELSYG